MQTKLYRTPSISPSLPAVFITNRSGDLAPCGFTDAEAGYVRKKIAREDEFILLQNAERYICIVLFDEKKPFSLQLESLRKLSARVNSAVQENDHTELTVADLANSPEHIAAFVEGLILSSYRFRKYITKPDRKQGFPEKLSLFSPSLQDEDLVRLQVVCEAVYIARDLVNEPLSHLNAGGLADRFRALGKKAGFSVEVMNKHKLESLRMGGLLAVNRGSVDPPTFSILEWKPENCINSKPFVLIGKGVVYDTGGLSLKPTHNSMDYMKCDMAGAAAVAAALYAIAACRLPVHVIALIPATDNRPDGNAIVPGDVIRMYDGTTVEVLNTDAEGRLLLADAISWARQYDPELVIDVATLTGSAAAAIGTCGSVAMHRSAGKWIEKLEESGHFTHERIVQFPLWEEYMEMLKSDVADIKNIGGKEAGAITAGKFLEHFTGFPWIHIDIAGPAFLHKAEDYRIQGGTGTGVRLLFDFFYRYSRG